MSKKEQIKLEIIEKCKISRKRIIIADIVIVLAFIMSFCVKPIAGIPIVSLFTAMIALPALVLINMHLNFINKAIKEPLKYKEQFKNLEANKLPNEVSDMLTDNDIKRITEVFKKMEQEKIPNILKMKDINPDIIPLESNTKLISSHEIVENLIRYVAIYMTIHKKIENIADEELSKNYNKFVKKYMSSSLNDEIKNINSFSTNEINELVNYLEYAWTYMWILGLYQGIPENGNPNELLQILNKYENYDDLYNNCRFLNKEQILSIADALTITYINLNLAQKTLNKEMPNTQSTMRQMLATHSLLSFEAKSSKE